MSNLALIKAKLLANQAIHDIKNEDEDMYCPYTYETTWDSFPDLNGDEQLYLNVADWSEVFLKPSDLDVRLGNPGKYDKHFSKHPVLSQIGHFLFDNNMEHEVWANYEMEGPNTVIVRLSCERDRSHFWMRFSEFTDYVK